MKSRRPSHVAVLLQEKQAYGSWAFDSIEKITENLSGEVEEPIRVMLEAPSKFSESTNLHLRRKVVLGPRRMSKDRLPEK